LFDLLFDPKDGGDMFLQNVGLSELHDITTQKTILFIVATMRTSSPTKETFDRHMNVFINTIINLLIDVINCGLVNLFFKMHVPPLQNYILGTA
jgi:hypothetical protein